MAEPALTLGQSAELLGGYRWVEQRLFEVTGEWSVAAGDPELQVYLYEMSAQHAWHAELFGARIPVLDWVDPDALTVAPGDGARALLDELGDTADGDLHRLGLLVRVGLPRLVASWTHHLEAASPPGDGPVMRALRLVRRDEVDGWVRGEILLQRLLPPGDVEALADHCARLEARLAVAAPGGGVVPWPRPVVPSGR